MYSIVLAQLITYWRQTLWNVNRQKRPPFPVEIAIIVRTLKQKDFQNAS